MERMQHDRDTLIHGSGRLLGGIVRGKLSKGDTAVVRNY